MTYSEAIDWLYSTQNFGIKLGLENPTRLLREYLAFPSYKTKVIQVAGTNGKGSTCAFIDSLARAASYRTGLFTSPHLISYRERARINGAMIPEEEVTRHLNALRDLVSDWENHPTFFELTLALAMRYFKDSECELIILEVGMGGRYDATTAIPTDANVITPIALDHQQWLGDTLAEIALEKASTCRPGKPVICAPQQSQATAVIEQVANETRSPLTWVETPLNGYPISLRGPHQALNASVAVETLFATGIELNYETVLHGVSHAVHEGRFEVIRNQDNTLILDIAHNPHATDSLVKTLQLEFPTQKPSLIFGAAESKDIQPMLAELSAVVSEIHLVPIHSPRSIPPETLASYLPEEAPKHHLHSSLASAMEATQENSIQLITGSAFLVGEAKATLSDSPHRATSQ